MEKNTDPLITRPTARLAGPVAGGAAAVPVPAEAAYALGVNRTGAADGRNASTGPIAVRVARTIAVRVRARNDQFTLARCASVAGEAQGITSQVAADIVDTVPGDALIIPHAGTTLAFGRLAVGCVAPVVGGAVGIAGTGGKARPGLADVTAAEIALVRRAVAVVVQAVAHFR